MIQVELEPETRDFYRNIVETLQRSGIPFLVGGAYAHECYTGISRHTKDLDIFVRGDDVDRVMNVLSAAGYQTELTFPHWLGKTYRGEAFIDIIFGSGNGIAIVDDGWFEHAVDSEVVGVPARIVPAEEMIWSKSFVMERERYDGADVAHLLRARGDRLDWSRLLDRFGPHWRVLLSHLILFGFIYPTERAHVPGWVMDRLLDQLREELAAPPPADGVCQGTLISREQYLIDIEQWGYRDARLLPRGKMTQREVAHWTAAIESEE